MDSDPNPDDGVTNPAYRKIHRDMVEVLRVQAGLVDATIHGLLTGEGAEDPQVLIDSQDVLDTVLPMIQGVGVSIRSIVKLNDDLGMSVRDCFGIARSISEGAINIAYIVASGVEVAAQARRHALQKTFRDFDRKGEFGGVRFEIGASSSPDPSQIAGLPEALAEFTRKNGTERTSWTDESLDGRIQLIAKRFPKANLSFGGSGLAIYRHSSEILHGTYFGSIYFWTAGTWFRPSRETIEYLLLVNHFTAVFGATLYAVYGLIEILRQEYRLPALRERNAKILDEALIVFGDVLPNLPRPGV